MTTARFYILFAVGFALLVGWLAFGMNAPSAKAAPACSAEPSAAIAQARAALADSGAARDHAALVCMVDALAALETRLDGLASGAIAFDGQIYAPMGVTMNKPQAKGGR